MSDDPKIDFYLRHRDRIEEWAALRTSASEFLHRGLLGAAEALRSDGAAPAVNIVPSSRRGSTWVQLPVTRSPLPDVYVEWSWDERTLLQPAHWRGWVTLEVVLSPDPPAGLCQAVADAVPLELRREHGLSKQGRDRWPWWGPMLPSAGPLDPQAYAQECATRAVRAWQDLHPVLTQATTRWSTAELLGERVTPSV